MVDLKDVGMRIRTARKRMGFTQEQLAEAAGVGTTHISHIETGTGKASLSGLLGIINALDCSADELLCMEVRQARPLHYEWLEELLDDCSRQELKDAFILALPGCEKSCASTQNAGRQRNPFCFLRCQKGK